MTADNHHLKNASKFMENQMQEYVEAQNQKIAETYVTKDINTQYILGQYVSQPIS